MTGTARLRFRPLSACPAETQDLKLVTPSTPPLPCPACLAGSQAPQRCSCFIVQNFPFRLDKPTGAAACSFSLVNYKSSAHARRAGTGREQKSPQELFGGLLFVAHLTHTVQATSAFFHDRMARGLRILNETNPIRQVEMNSSNSRIFSDTGQQSMTLSKEANAISTVGQSTSHHADSSVEQETTHHLPEATQPGASDFSSDNTRADECRFEPRLPQALSQTR